MLRQSPLCLTFKRLDTEVTATVYSANNLSKNVACLSHLLQLYSNALQNAFIMEAKL